MSAIKFSQLRTLTNPTGETLFPVVYNGANWKVTLDSIRGSIVNVTWSDVQNKPTFHETAFSGDYTRLNNLPTIPTNTNQLTNGSGYITTSSITWSNLTGKPTFATVATSGSYVDLLNKPVLSAVAISGSYNDLSDKPTIPTNTNQLTNGAGYITSASITWESLQSSVPLAMVAKTGSYNDLSNKPTLISSTDKLTSGTQTLILDKNGTITPSLLLPKTFTATLDPAHFVGELTLTGDAWEFVVQFQVNPNGTVQTMIGNNTPFVSNPGYVDGQQFTYTETDHGIPGYTFTLGLADVLLAGPAGWTTNLTASVPPEYPSTVKSLGAIKLTTDTQSWVFGADGQLTVPGAIFRDGGLYMNSSGSTTAASVFVNGFAGDVILRTADNANNVSHDLIFDVNGNLRLPGNVTYPGGITQSRQDDTFCSAGVDTVVYTSTGEFQHAIKLFVMIEGMAPNGDGVNWDTQACDVIAVKGFANNIVHVTTYGVTYTSAAAFATFDGQWNATTNRIEITCRPVSPTHGVTVSVHAIEMLSNN